MLPLNRSFNVAVNHITNKLFPCGYDLTADEIMPEDMIAHYDKTRRILVSKAHSDNTIFACPETNWNFRAWHDLRHITSENDFTFNGEYNTAFAQIADIYKLYDGKAADNFADLIRAEVIGQAYYFHIMGKFPVDQFRFVTNYLQHACDAVYMQGE